MRFLDIAMAVAAVGSLALTVLLGLPPFRTDRFSGSDFKTLYASMWCFLHRQNAYSFPNLGDVFHRSGVVLPTSWFGHAPVYPPITLALLSPLANLGMGLAMWVTFGVSTVLFTGGVSALVRYARTTLTLPFLWRMPLIAFCASIPALPFALSLGNVSAATAGLLMMSFLWRDQMPPWLTGAALSGAFLLKPHMAAWLIVCMLLLRDGRSRTAAVWACGIVGAFSAIVFALLAWAGDLTMQAKGWLDMLHSEQSSAASMSAGARESLPLVAQLTSLKSALGFWISQSRPLSALNALALLGVAALLVRLTRQAGTERQRLLCVGTWSAFGMVAIYHREHDGLLLLLLLPWLLDRMRGGPRSWPFFGAMICFCIGFFGPSLDTTTAAVAHAPATLAGSILWFVLFRQAAIADCLLVLCLLVLLTQSIKSPARSIADPTTGPARREQNAVAV